MSLLKGNKIQMENMQITSENALHLYSEFEKCPVMWDLYMQLTAGDAEEAQGLLQATQPLCPGAQVSTSFCGVTLKTQLPNWGR